MPTKTTATHWFLVLVTGSFFLLGSHAFAQQRWCPPGTVPVNPAPTVRSSNPDCIVRVLRALSRGEEVARSVTLQGGESYWFAASGCPKMGTIRIAIENAAGHAERKTESFSPSFCYTAPTTGTYTLRITAVSLRVSHGSGNIDACLSHSRCGSSSITPPPKRAENLAPVNISPELRMRFSWHRSFVKYLSDVPADALGIDPSNHPTTFEGRGSLTLDPSIALHLRFGSIILAGGVTQPIHLSTIPCPGCVGDYDVGEVPSDRMHYLDGEYWGLDERSSLGSFVEAGVMVGKKKAIIIGYSRTPYQLRFTAGNIDTGCGPCGEDVTLFEATKKIEIVRTPLATIYGGFRIGPVLFTVSRTKNPFPSHLQFLDYDFALTPARRYQWGGNMTLILGRW